MGRCILLVLLATAAVSCNSARVAVQKSNILAKYPRLAIMGIEINFIQNRMQEADPLNKYVALLDKYVYQKLGQLLGVKGSGSATASRDTRDLHALAFESINRNFLERGFLVVERERMKSLYKEIGFSQSGLSSDTRKQVGQMASADTLYFARINIEVVKGWFKNKIRLSYAARAISVEEGFILMSGESVTSHSTFKPEQVPQLIETWFNRVPELD